MSNIMCKVQLVYDPEMENLHWIFHHITLDFMTLDFQSN